MGCQSGHVLVTMMGGSVLVAGLIYASTAFSSVEVNRASRALQDVRSRTIAEAGVERAVHLLRGTARKSNFYDPLWSVRRLFDDGFGGRRAVVPFAAQAVPSVANRLGDVTVSMTALDVGSGIEITVVSTGYVPAAPKNLKHGQRLVSRHTLTATLRIDLAPSRFFEAAYSINNWGWFYGNPIECHGNVRCNGLFDAANYSPLITGQPLYDELNWVDGKASLSGYQDDNEDGKSDGNDGGIFTAQGLAGVSKLRGNGGKKENQHTFVEPEEMPNLTDMTLVEAKARPSGSIWHKGKKICDGVYGDDPGEKTNLMLLGTAVDPVEIRGMVVVRGHLVISGVVTGQGALYVGGNAYVPKDIVYKNPPATARPADNTQAATEAWLTENKDKDFLGLFAREHIAVGDFTAEKWRMNVQHWMDSEMNGSAEDAGIDQVPNTANGKDGKAKTADDDVLEGDGKWTVERYTDVDKELGIIPPGKVVGDAIPGTGEDIDGDGLKDGTTSMVDLEVLPKLNHANFGGTIEEGASFEYRDIASTDIRRLDGVFYTNHSFSCATFGAGSAFEVRGALISRNENIIFGKDACRFLYDARLLGGASGLFAPLLPRVLQPIRVVSWEVTPNDPNATYSSNP